MKHEIIKGNEDMMWFCSAYVYVYVYVCKIGG